MMSVRIGVFETRRERGGGGGGTSHIGWTGCTAVEGMGMAFTKKSLHFLFWAIFAIFGLTRIIGPGHYLFIAVL